MFKHIRHFFKKINSPWFGEYTVVLDSFYVSYDEVEEMKRFMLTNFGKTGFQIWLHSESRYKSIDNYPYLVPKVIEFYNKLDLFLFLCSYSTFYKIKPVEVR
jgi:hypothetical protein